MHVVLVLAYAQVQGQLGMVVPPPQLLDTIEKVLARLRMKG